MHPFSATRVPVPLTAGKRTRTAETVPESPGEDCDIPLLGCRVDIAGSRGKTFPLLLFCSDFTGYRNLKALLSIPALKGGHPVNLKNLKSHCEGLTAVISGEERDLSALFSRRP